MNSDCDFCTLGKTPFPEEYRTWKITKDFYALIPRGSVQPAHIMIIPFMHFSALREIPEKLIGEIFTQAIAFGEKLMQKCGANAYFIKVNNELFSLEKNSTRHVGHIHIHIIPRYKEDDVFVEGGNDLSVEECLELKKLLTE